MAADAEVGDGVHAVPTDAENQKGLNTAQDAPHPDRRAPKERPVVQRETSSQASVGSEEPERVEHRTAEPPSVPRPPPVTKAYGSASASPAEESAAEGSEVAHATIATTGDTDRSQTGETDERVAAILVDGHLSAAYWVGKALEPGIEQFTLDALYVTALSAAVGNGNHGPEEALDLALQQTISSSDPSPSELLYAAAAMRLLFTKPYGVATSVLREAARDLSHFPSIEKACSFLADRAASGALLELGTSDDARRLTALEDRRGEIVRRAREGAERWPKETHGFHPVNRIWRQWTTGSGPLHAALTALGSGERDLSIIDARLEAFIERRSLDRQIDAAYKEGRARRGDRLEASARRWLHERVERVTRLASEWRELVLEERIQQSGVGRDLAGVRREFDAIDRSVQATLDELGSQAASHAAAAHIAAQAWSRVGELVSGVRVSGGAGLTVDEAVNGDLVRAWALALGENGAPRANLESEAVEEIGRALDRSWLEAFEHRFEEGDHVATLVALRRLEAEGEAVSELRTRREQDVHAKRIRLNDRRAQLQVRLSRLLSSGALGQGQHDVLRARLLPIRPGEVLNFAEVEDVLALVDHELDEASSAWHDQLATRLGTVDTDEGIKGRLTELLGDEQYDVAEELIGRLERGETVSEPTLDVDPLKDFIETLKGLSDNASALRRLSELEGAPEDQGAIQQAREAINQLQTLRGPLPGKGMLAQRVRLILATLGMDVVGNSVKPLRGLPQIHEAQFEALPVGASWVPPAFASSVGADIQRGLPGHYQLLVARAAVRERELIELVRRHQASGRAVVVLAVEPLTLARRQQLARAARSEQVTFLLADALNLVHQATSRAAGGGTAPFDLWLTTALPFAWIDPYVTQGNVPPEMFVGRREELRTLQEPSGSSFVFGGRQLGKSALLRVARTQSHAPRQHRVGILIDLKMEGVGSRLPAERIWEVISAHLTEAGLPVAQGVATQEGVARRVREWLSENRSRQLRLFLDETDLFLEAEAADRHFPNILGLRNLMEETDRRFKVILAGLHSVNRFRRIPNQPLAQFGTTAPIGPLSWPDARTLVETPMRAAGFRFDPPDLVHRVLVESRRHPSLLQFACRALIEHFSGARAGRGANVPITINAAQLDQVFEREDLRERIRERFDWTLNLDPRYRVIALIVALRALEDPQLGAVGLLARDLWEQALAYWERGFASITRDEFDVLLEEMINLEVLIETEGRFRLPSTSVMRLLGDEHQVIDALSAEVERDPFETPSPERLRRPLGDLRSIERSPLTLSDERRLLSPDGPPLRVVFGTPALHVQHVLDALKLAAQADHPEVSLKIAEARIQLGRVGVGKEPESFSVTAGSLVVDDPEATIAQLRKVATRLGKRRTGAEAAVIVVDHRSIAHWPTLYEGLELDLESDARWLALKRWDLDQVSVWLEDLEIPVPDRTARARMVDRTGGWIPLLERCACFLRERSWGLDEALAATVDEPEQLESLVAMLELHRLADDRYLQALMEWPGAMDAGELATIVEPGGDRAVAQELLDTLWLGQATALNGERRYELDATVGRALEASRLAAR
jgi:hypothetical protein